MNNQCRGIFSWGIELHPLRRGSNYYKPMQRLNIGELEFVRHALKSSWIE